MAHFAELDENNIVTRVLVVNNEVITIDGEENEQIGIDFLNNLCGGGTWKQTSYNNNFRKRYAGKGIIYNTSKNKFLLSQPYASWSLNGSDDWQAPVTYPADQSAYAITWDEDNLRWLGTKVSDNSNHRWDADNTEWVSL